VATALVQLDDFTVENGCLQVTPGSHLHGKHVQRADGAGLDKLEIDVNTYDMASLIPLPAPAGSVIFFGGFLIHASAPNRSGKDRRALLYSYQPAGFPHVRELNARLKERSA
jgi:ectoine hydroxylase